MSNTKRDLNLTRMRDHLEQYQQCVNISLSDLHVVMLDIKDAQLNHLDKIVELIAENVENGDDVLETWSLIRDGQMIV